MSKKYIQIPGSEIKVYVQSPNGESLSLSKEMETLIFTAVKEASSEWDTANSIEVGFVVYDNESFRQWETTLSSANKWKYCFLIRDHRNKRVHINTSILNVLPDDAVVMTKHETTHIVVSSMVPDDVYFKSFLLEEGTAGLDNCSERLVDILESKGYENVSALPSPLTFVTIADVKKLGGNTEVEPFIEQIGYLIMYSFVEFMKDSIGRNKLITIYKMLNSVNPETNSLYSLEEAYLFCMNEEIESLVQHWREYLKSLIV